jgi:ATP-binding cassette subfamily F protein uup
MGELSGGEAKRVALACMMLQNADFLIMDEPTNHLDIDIIEYLEGYLQRSRCTLLMVTHDRYFLDRVCNTIMEIDRGKLFAYRGNYSEYLEKREERYLNMQAEIDKSRNLLRRELEWIRSTPQARTGKARYRINAFYDLKDKASVSLRTDSVEIDVATSRLGRKIIDCTDVSLQFEGRKMLDNFSYKFTRGERVGIVGRNGVGKTTFLNLMAGNLTPDSGSIEQGETLRIGYYTQRGINFKPGQTVLECVQEVADVVKASDGHAISATTYLNRFLFPHETFNKRVDILSGGEKRRLYLLIVLMQNPNMLILDEPTNDLDIMTLNVLEEYLSEFKGSLLIVSHDRYFLDKCTDHLFVFEGDGRIKDFVGHYSEYREFVKEREANERSEQRSNAPQKPQQQRTHNNTKRKLSFKEQRELEQLEADIATLSNERTSLESEISSGTLPYERLSELSKRIEELITTIDEKEMRWLELNE